MKESVCVQERTDLRNALLAHVTVRSEVVECIHCFMNNVWNPQV